MMYEDDGPRKNLPPCPFCGAHCEKWCGEFRCSASSPGEIRVATEEMWVAICKAMKAAEGKSRG